MAPEHEDKQYTNNIPKLKAKHRIILKKKIIQEYDKVRARH